MIAALPTIVGIGFPVIALVLCLAATASATRVVLVRSNARGLTNASTDGSPNRKTLDGLRAVTSLATAVLFVLFARQSGSWQILGNASWYVLTMAFAVAAGATVLAVVRLPFTQPDLPRSVLASRWANAAVSVAMAAGAGMLLI